MESCSGATSQGTEVNEVEPVPLKGLYSRGAAIPIGTTEAGRWEAPGTGGHLLARGIQTMNRGLEQAWLWVGKES